MRRLFLLGVFLPGLLLAGLLPTPAHADPDVPSMSDFRAVAAPYDWSIMAARYDQALEHVVARPSR